MALADENDHVLLYEVQQQTAAALLFPLVTAPKLEDMAFGPWETVDKACKATSIEVDALSPATPVRFRIRPLTALAGWQDWEHVTCSDVAVTERAWRPGGWSGCVP